MKVSLSQRVTVRRVVDLHIIWTSRLPINNSLSVVWGRHAGIHLIIEMILLDRPCAMG